MAIDILFHNGVILPMTERDARMRVLAVEGGRIVYIGTSVPQDILATAKHHIDLEGQCVVPGFTDCHAYPLAAALRRVAVDVHGITHIDELAFRLRAKRQERPKHRMLVSFGLEWNPKTPLSRRLLDELEPHGPWIVVAASGDCAVVNSALAQRLASRKTHPIQIPDDGVVGTEDICRIVATGIGGAALRELRRSITNVFYDLQELGITTVHAMDSADCPDARDWMLLAAVKRVLRIGLSLYYQTTSAKLAAVANHRHVGARILGAGDEPIMDGIPRTVACFDQRDTLRSYVRSAHRRGLQVALVAPGPDSINLALDAFEFAQESAFHDLRHRIELLCLPKREQIRRIVDLGLGVTVFAGALKPSPKLDRLVHQCRSQPELTLLPMRTLVENRVLLGFGSGYPATDVTPLETIHLACNHPIAEERLTPYQALVAFTSDAAWLSMDETEKGTLSMGRRADMVVLSENPLDVLPERLRDIRVVETYCAGRLVRRTAFSRSRFFVQSTLGRFRDAVGMM